MWKTPLMSLHLPRHQGDSDSMKPVGQNVYGKDAPVYSDFKDRPDGKADPEDSIENLGGFMCTFQNKRLHFLAPICNMKALRLDVLAPSVSVKWSPENLCMANLLVPLTPHGQHPIPHLATLACVQFLSLGKVTSMQPGI